MAKRTPKSKPPKPDELAAQAAPAPVSTPEPPTHEAGDEARPWELRVDTLDVNLIDPDPDNVNQHTDDSLRAVDESLNAFGQQKPIVVVPTEDGRYIVIAGNATLKQAKAKQWPKIAAVISTLKGNDRKAYAIVDNRSTRLSEWNYKGLQIQLRELAASGYHMPSTGWFGGELGNIINTTWTPPTPPAGGETSSDSAAGEEEEEEIVYAESLQFTKEEWALVTELKKRLGAATEKGAVLMLIQKSFGPGQPA